MSLTTKYSTDTETSAMIGNNPSVRDYAMYPCILVGFEWEINALLLLPLPHRSTQLNCYRPSLSLSLILRDYG